MSAWSTKPRRLTLPCEARRSVVEKRPTEHLPRVGKSQQAYNKNPGVPWPGHLQPTTRMETLAKVFWVNLPASVEKRPFSANDRSKSPEPEFSALPHLHQRMRRGRADQVCAIWQVISAGAQRVLDSKGPIERLSRRRQSFIKLINH